MPPTTAALDADEQDRLRWAHAGLDRLTGPAHGPGLGPPPGFVGRVDGVTDRLRTASRAAGTEIDVDGLAELAVRAELSGHRRRGEVSCGGSCHLVRASDAWFAVSLARPDDWELLPAWLGVTPAAATTWSDVHGRSRHLPVAELIGQGVELGLPIGALAESSSTPPDRLVASTPRGRSRRSGPLRVADLSSMWAGPLCGSILAAAGAEVVKVESLQRPDGTRRGSPAHHELLNGAKRPLVVDLAVPEGVDELRAILASVDVVIESARPRALLQFGIDAEGLLEAPSGPALWISITGHGRDGTNARRVAFGDDAAVSGGLVSWWEDRPLFCADAVADPLTGLWAATVALEALAEERTGLLDVAMSRVAAHFAGSQADR